MNAWTANALCNFFGFVAAYTFLRWQAQPINRPMIFAHLGIAGDLLELLMIVGAIAGFLSGGVWSHRHLSWYAFPLTTVGIAILFPLLMRSFWFELIATSAIGPLISLAVMLWLNWWMWS
jgi:hypothetical protein